MSDIESERKAIDTIDQELVRLLLDRARCVMKIGELKREKTTALYRPEREKAVYDRVRALARSLAPDLPHNETFIVNTYREIMSGALALEGGLRVAYLGPEGSFSGEAARNRFGSFVEGISVPSIAEVFRSVETGRADYGIVPVENSLRGSIGPTMDQFLQSDLIIYAEHYEKIRLHLLSPKEDRSPVRILYSMREAREQCTLWLQQNLNYGALEMREVESTARAAQILSREQEKGSAAIASEAAARIYDLAIRQADIQDSGNNCTRFVIVGKHQARESGEDRTSIIVGLHDRPGSLFALLKHFNDATINLTRIESRVSRRAYGDYYFFIDFMGHQEEERVRLILNKIEAESAFLKVLGSYPCSVLPE
ncbi:MAG: prephenate dehydratase [Spirochaetales bacterium]|nr:prephenate dehydratase [Spirochaetales bacterium]